MLVAEHATRLSAGLTIAELFRREPVYAGAALCCAASMLPTAFALALDQRTFQGHNVWVKPLKFEFALFAYLATLAWFAGWLPHGVMASRWYRGHVGLVVFAAVAEIVWVTGAAAFGTASHFNNSQPVMARLYTVMGAFAVLLTTATLPYGVMIWRNKQNALSHVVRLSVGLGLLLTFVLTFGTASYLSSQLGHQVGVANATQPELPVMGWSRTAGDLRVAHFFATHAMHVLPVVGVFLSRVLPATAGRAGVFAFGGFYAAFVVFTLVQAASGHLFLILGL